jgi:hypothetical protein
MHIQRLPVLMISLVVVVVLGLQVFAGFRNPGPWGWPFVAYPMYAEARHEGDRVIYDLAVFVVDPGGGQSRVTPEDLGMQWWWFRQNVVGQLLLVESDLLPDDAAIVKGRLQSVVDDYCQRSGREVAGLRMEDLGIAVGREGMVTGLPPEELAAVELTCTGQ